MSNHNTLIDRYIAVWNETDAARRNELITQTYTEDASYIDPLMASEGHDGISAMVGGVQAQFPGYRFHLTSSVDAHNNRVRFTWSLGPNGGDALIKGTDFAVVASGRLQSVIGFIDQMPEM